MALFASALVLHRTLTAFKNKISGSEPTNLKYKDSFAEPLDDIGGYKRWVLAGTALKVWEDDLCARVAELERENEGEIYKGHNIRHTATIRRCWMVGHDVSSARPTVVIFCNVSLILKRTMRAISRLGVLKKKDFNLKGCPHCDLQLLTAASSGQLIHRVNKRSQGLPESLCGAEIRVGDSIRSATLGGVIILDETYFGVTVAHAFTEGDRAPKQKEMVDADVILYDCDWADSNSEEGSKGKETTIDTGSSQPSSYEEPYENCQITLSTTGSNSLATQNIIRNYRVTNMSSESPLRHADSSEYDGGDWALLKMDPPIHHGMNGAFLDSDERDWLYFNLFRREAPRGSIMIVTRAGIVLGAGMGLATSIRPHGSSRYRNVWPIRSERVLEIGDSGSWVVDAATGDFHGVLVAGSAMMREGYVIPALEIVEDIRRATGARSLRLPTKGDALRLASRYGDHDLVNSLLAAGADISFLEQGYSAKNFGADPSPPHDPPDRAPGSSYSSRPKHPAQWLCGHCEQKIVMNIGLQDQCISCGRQCDVYSINV